MKIAVATIYGALNYGGYLQAYSMQTFLESKGHRVEFLNLDTKEFKRYRLRSIITRHPKRLAFNIKLYSAYRSDMKKLHIARKSSYTDKTHYDAAVLGSDEIWNVNNRTFMHPPQYFGGDIDTDNVVGYALSAGHADYKSIMHYPNAENYIKNAKALFARDENTKAIIDRITARDTETVLDPTFLIDMSDLPQVTLEPCVLVYNYNGYYDFTEEQIARIKRFAADKGIPTVGIGFYHEWCDRCIACRPTEFPSYIRQAKYVITDTFHGTVISIQQNANFAVFVGEKHKVVSVIKLLGLTGRDITDVEDLNDVFNSRIDYEKVNSTVDTLADKSRNALLRALGD